jgi:hypothetical protein
LFCFCVRRSLRIAWAVHGANEAKPLARDGADEPLFLAVVADRASRGVDSAVQRRVGDDPSAPHQGNEIVPADHAIMVLQQVDQQVEHLWLHRHQLVAAAELATIGVQDVIIEIEFHVCFLKKQSSPSEEELKHNAKSCGRSSCIVSRPAAANPIAVTERIS